MRADRLLSIVLLLQKHRRLTAGELAEQLGVSERTIYRDIDALSLSGVPVYTQTGPDGGCFLEETYRTSLFWFTATELQTLLFAGTAAPLSELGLKTEMANAVLKLLAQLPERHQKQADDMQQRLYLDPSGWYGNRDEVPALQKVKDAVWQDRVIEVLYISWSGQESRRVLEPYSLVYKSGRWYLVARACESGEMHTYRVSRLQDVVLQNAEYERDPEFDVVSYWQTASEDFIHRIPSYPVTLRVRPYLMPYFNTALPGRFTVLESDAVWWTLTVQYTVFEEARSSVLGLGVDAEVIEPQALHDAVVLQARQITAKWDPSNQ